MPETILRLRWPDDTETVNYSPSTIITKFFEAGRTYRVAEFVVLSHRALAAASARVQEIHGHGCSRAAATLARIEADAAKFAGTDEVIVLGFGV